MQARFFKSLPVRIRFYALLVALMILTALLAPVISPYNPREMQIGQSNLQPAWYPRGRADHLLGTDLYGRDILSRALHGLRAAMFLVLIAIPLTALIGVAMGIAAGMGNDIAESIFLRVTDIFSSAPSFMFSLIVIFIVRPTPAGQIFGGLVTLTLAFAFANWVGLARLVYASTLRVRRMDFMEAARSLGAGPFHQVFKHILPHASHLIITWVVNNIPAVILLEALLGYIGVQILQVTDGSSFQDLSWGGLILTGRTQLNYNPFILLVPTLFLLLVSMSFTMLSEHLNERLNPHVNANQLK